MTADRTSVRLDRRTHAPLLAASFFLVAAAVPAHAGVPDPRYSEADTCVVVSPAGAFTYTVRLRDDSLAPVADVDVVLDFTDATGIVLCSTSDPDNDRRVLGHTDALGYAVFRVRGGGKSNGIVEVQALATLVRGAFARSTDLDGDLSVDADDATAHQALPASSRAGDYDCDGDADAADRAWITSQLGQNCLTVPTLKSTWGAVKSFYRN